MTEIIQVRWCALCNACPSAGTLHVEAFDGEVFGIDACRPCVDKLAREHNTTMEELEKHEY